MGMKVDRKAAIKKLRSFVLPPRADIEHFREIFDKKFETQFLPNNIELVETVLGGIPCDILIPEIFSSNRTLLYIHGGFFVAGSRRSYRSFCASFANTACSRLIVPEFRLAPNHPFPASSDDCLSVLKSIFSDKGDVVLVADGTGASIALSLILRLDSEQRKRIRDIVLFSPCIDFSPKNAFLNSRKSDEIISTEFLHRVVDLYTYESNLQNPLISTLEASENQLENFPPTFIQLGEKEILLKPTQEFCKKLTDFSINCTLDVWQDMMFMFQLADEFLPESHLALEKAGQYVRRREELTAEEKAERLKILKKNDIGDI